MAGTLWRRPNLCPVGPHQPAEVTHPMHWMSSPPFHQNLLSSLSLSRRNKKENSFSWKSSCTLRTKLANGTTLTLSRLRLCCPAGRCVRRGRTGLFLNILILRGRPAASTSVPYGTFGWAVWRKRHPKPGRQKMWFHSTLLKNLNVRQTNKQNSPLISSWMSVTFCTSIWIWFVLHS